MEAEVLAALIATPTTLTVGGFAYFAGRAQARAALRGPVDSVRRSAQRDAYADLLSAAREYASKIQWNAAARLALDGGGDGDFPDLPEIYRRVVMSLMRMAVEPVRHAVAVVSLEGPDRLVPLAEAIEQCAEDFRTLARDRYGRELTDEDRRETRSVLKEKAGEVTDSIPPFVVAARAYLNGGLPGDG